MSSFWRSNRFSGSNQSSHPQTARRGNSLGDMLAASNPQSHLDAATAAPPHSISHNQASLGSSSTQMTLRGMERLERRRTMEERSLMNFKSRAHGLNASVDLRLLDYVSPCDENLVCPICRCPFVDPVVLSECDHCFCRDCIRQTWTTTTTYHPGGSRGDCPTCRTPAKLGARSATSKILVNILDDLVVRCPQSEDGCKAKIKRGEVRDHISIYCSYAMVDCPSDSCELSLRRKDAVHGCLHFPVSCIACREEMHQCDLEIHWRNKCAERETQCDQCQAKTYYRDISEHKQRLCPASNIPCPGELLGCTFRSRRGQAEAHAKSCTFAILAPVIAAQSQRLREQEAAQKQFNRKLEILESGFATMQNIMYPPQVPDPDQTSADPSSIPLLQGHGDEDVGHSDDPPNTSLQLDDMQLLALDRMSTRPRRVIDSDQDVRTTAPLSGTHPTDIPQSSSADFDLDSPLPPLATNSPYASPLHHLLSLHESLREEMSRVSTALQELDGRHSMQILNENMRTREEITYMGAQVAGLSRQVHWLTSTQLQRQGLTSASGNGTDIAGAANPSVESAISSAVRGAARIVSASNQGMTALRRGPSEEGRTKL